MFQNKLEREVGSKEVDKPAVLKKLVSPKKSDRSNEPGEADQFTEYESSPEKSEDTPSKYQMIEAAEKEFVERKIQLVQPEEQEPDGK